MGTNSFKALVLCTLFSFFLNCETLSWQGLQWTVKTGKAGPGPNNWSPDNVFVDSDGALHLKITNDQGTWFCAELYTDQLYGFGTFQWQVDARIDQLDPNVVLGLFQYGGPDGQNEIDIEFSRWGDSTYYPGSFTVYPSVSGFSPTSYAFPFSLSGTYTTSRYSWSSTGVEYRFMGGFQPLNSTTNLIQSWNFQPSNSNRVPQHPMIVDINLWLFNGHAPQNGQPVEVIIRGFQKS
eukprot:TRINITY_DN13693_c0_g1_i1.p1 TRINITY_DN13693_c0_g1~~TRINITY_DN13693_c0_g1_i1.p1  ORF type:complete len:236 (-),score=38.91 TRINITY_DN13693_c0_g1_i1:159-866(-)